MQQSLEKVAEAKKHTGRGLFIVVEGFDGCGKSTVVQELHHQLTAKGIDHILTREPGGTEFGNQCRTLLLEGDYQLEAETEVMLLQAARIENWNKVISPALEKGLIVVCDRFTPSTYAYQGIGKGLGIWTVSKIVETTTPHSFIDVIINVTSDYETARKRITDKGSLDNMEQLEDEKLRRIHDAYNNVVSLPDFKKCWLDLPNNGTLQQLKDRVSNLVSQL